jgi:hypothetical protein
MAKVVDIVKQQSELLFKLRKTGVTNLDTITDAYSVYQIYLGYENVTEKMVRYSMTAEKSKISIQSVMKNVKLMERNI